MREILFRGKRIDNGEWVEGYYVYLEAGKMWSHRIYTGYAEVDVGDFYPDFFEVSPATIAQFTGLTDKNGEKIFEGDIVRYGDSIHLVVFEKRAGNAYFGIVMDEQETWGFCPSVPSNKMEVIGNIHDNPELL